MTKDLGTRASRADERDESPDGAPLHALLIGIDRYTPDTTPGAPFFRTLGGCTDVVAVAAYLRESHPRASVTLLAAPPDGVAPPMGAPD